MENDIDPYASDVSSIAEYKSSIDTGFEAHPPVDRTEIITMTGIRPS